MSINLSSTLAPFQDSEIDICACGLFNEIQFQTTFIWSFFLMWCVFLATAFSMLCAYCHIYNTRYVDCSDIIIHCPLQIELTCSFCTPWVYRLWYKPVYYLWYKPVLRLWYKLVYCLWYRTIHCLRCELVHRFWCKTVHHSWYKPVCHNTNWFSISDTNHFITHDTDQFTTYDTNQFTA